MEKKDYLALVCREANLFLGAREAELRSAARAAELTDEIDSHIEEQVKEILSEVDHLEDVIKWSEFGQPAPALWREAEQWEEVLIGVALAALVHDVRMCAIRTLRGELPRLRNVQVRRAT